MIGEDDARCFDNDGISMDTCWAWAIDEHHEVLAVTYGEFVSPAGGGFQLFTMPTNAVNGAVLKKLQATPVPEPHPLLLQAVRVLAVAGLGCLRRKRRGWSARS